VDPHLADLFGLFGEVERGVVPVAQELRGLARGEERQGVDRPLRIGDDPLDQGGEMPGQASPPSPLIAMERVRSKGAGRKPRRIDSSSSPAQGTLASPSPKAKPASRESSGRCAFCRMNMAWKIGERLGSRSGCSRLAMSAKGKSWCS
jgi:hypothetical protein